jgi:hypothetical protein
MLFDMMPGLEGVCKEFMLAQSIQATGTVQAWQMSCLDRQAVVCHSLYRLNLVETAHRIAGSARNVPDSA